MDAAHALWTFPAVIFAALIIAWAAECGQFSISQGLALAVLAWVQTLPEFAVEAVITWEAAQDVSRMHLITANFTGSLRLFVGFGWPMVYFVALFCRRRRSSSEGSPGTHRRRWAIQMDDEHSIAVLSLLPALLYFLYIYGKGSLGMGDGVVLIAIYSAYLWLVSRMPPKDREEQSDLGRIPRYVMGLPRRQSHAAVAGLFLLGAVLLYFIAHPFLESMLGLAAALGISEFVFVQWVAPFLSEFPEKLSAFYWARQDKKAPMALTNFISSSINQWTVLVATIPFIYSLGLGRAAPVVFDEHQRVEILLTIVQSYLGFLFLASMDFGFLEAVGLFGLWGLQFFIPGIREEITLVYALWAGWETLKLAVHFRRRNAFSVFASLAKARLFQRI